MSCRYPSTEVNRDCKESTRAVQGRLQKRITSIFVKSLLTISARNLLGNSEMKSGAEILSQLGSRSPNLPNRRPERPKLALGSSILRVAKAPEIDQLGPNFAQERPTWAQERPTSTQERRTWAQERPTSTQEPQK